MCVCVEQTANMSGNIQEERLQVIKSKQQSGDSSLTLNDYRGMEFTQCVSSDFLLCTPIKQNL